MKKKTKWMEPGRRVLAGGKPGAITELAWSYFQGVAYCAGVTVKLDGVGKPKEFSPHNVHQLFKCDEIEKPA